ncbi:MAG TPA: CopD family protein, partial [Aggregatilineaceae bacterium]|nr:CopD family protein [Aggregatilineaceae bacterium]
NLMPEGSFSDHAGLFRVLAASCGTAIVAMLAEAALARTNSIDSLVWFRLLLLVGVGALLVFRRSWWWGGALLCSLALLASDLNSPAAVAIDPMVAAAVDWIHLLALAIWLGGLVALALALRWLQSAPSPVAMAQVARRFFQVALLCLVVVILTGVYRAADAVGDPANLIDTAYGMATLVKLGLLIPLLGLVVWNRITIPRRPDAEPRVSQVASWYRRTLWTAGVEAALGLTILLMASILTDLPLPRDLFGAGLVQHQQVADLRVILAANPGQPGKNSIDMYLRDPIGRPIVNASKVALTFSMLDHNMGVGEAVADNAGSGRYTARGSYLEMVGTWRVGAVIGRAGRGDVQTAFVLPIGLATGTPGPLVLAYPSRALFGLELIVAGIVLGVSAPRFRRIGEWARVLSILFAVTIGLVGAGIISSGFVAGYVQASTVNNPVPADTASLARGQQFYQTLCSACHGVAGRGDGPASAGLQPPPADLRVHMAAGHTDGQLFEWISNGIPNTAMPAFGSRLSENDRWNVINYLRLFALTR